jgi:membrane protein required for beta-lactamase induction
MVIALALVAWIVVSVPVSLLVGRMLHALATDERVQAEPCGAGREWLPDRVPFAVAASPRGGR